MKACIESYESRVNATLFTVLSIWKDYRTISSHLPYRVITAFRNEIDHIHMCNIPLDKKYGIIKELDFLIKIVKNERSALLGK